MTQFWGGNYSNSLRFWSNHWKTCHQPWTENLKKMSQEEKLQVGRQRTVCEAWDQKVLQQIVAWKSQLSSDGQALQASWTLDVFFG